MIFGELSNTLDFFRLSPWNYNTRSEVWIVFVFWKLKLELLDILEKDQLDYGSLINNDLNQNHLLLVSLPLPLRSCQSFQYLLSQILLETRSQISYLDIYYFLLPCFCSPCHCFLLTLHMCRIRIHDLNDCSGIVMILIIFKMCINMMYPSYLYWFWLPLTQAPFFLQTNPSWQLPLRFPFPGFPGLPGWPPLPGVPPTLHFSMYITQ